MTAGNWLALKLLFSIHAAVFGLAAAFFHWRAAIAKSKLDRSRDWFARKWSAIGASPWLSMPERIIKWLLCVKKILADWVVNVSDSDSFDRVLFKIISIVLPVSFSIGIWILFGFVTAIWAFLICLLVMYLLAMVSNKIDRLKDSQNIGKLLFYGSFLVVAALPLQILVSLFSLAATIIWMLLLQRLPTLMAPPVMLVLAPIFWVGLSAVSIGPRIALAYSASLIVTTTALAIGRTSSPQAWVPQTTQMVVSNLIFDTLTVFTTLLLLSWATRKNNAARIPVAVLLDILIAAVLALLSLFCGLAGTEHAISARGALNVLIARSVNGEHWELGPYFWIMHTTFFPTIIYLFLIFLCWLAKMMLLSTSFVLGEAKASENPHIYTARLLFFVAALFTLFAAGSAIMESRAPHEAPEEAQEQLSLQYVNP